MKRLSIFLPMAAALSLTADAVVISFEGNTEKVIKVTPEKSTGLDQIYVAYDASQIKEMNISGLSGTPQISRYSNLGGGYAEEIKFSYSSSVATVENPEGNMGYIITDSAGSTYIWLVDYLPYKFELTSARASEYQGCDDTTLDISGEGKAIHYYTIDGRQAELSRDIQIKYFNLVWDESSETYSQNSFTKTLAHLTPNVSITPPLYCNSVFSITGDRFLKEWGRAVTIDSSLVYANGLSVHTTAVQTNADPDEGKDSNVIKTQIQGMGGSAPVDIEFRAYTTDAVIHNEWQIAKDEGFDYIDYRFNEQSLDYTFNDEGTYYIRYVGSNADGSCEIFGDTYTVGVGASELKIPNAFTPNGDGVNDEWKVAYRSLVNFHCTIFDRYGNELFRFSDPNKGWDGKYRGKYVSPGVYFYVIEATGADGKKYKKGGDINIIKSKKYTGNSSGEATPVE